VWGLGVLGFKGFGFEFFEIGFGFRGLGFGIQKLWEVGFNCCVSGFRFRCVKGSGLSV